MSISSISNPSALLSQITSKNPLAAAAAYGAGSFLSTLMQAMQQTGTSASSTGAANGTAVTATTGAHHGHHGGGMAAQLQNLQAGTATAPGRLLNTAV